MMGRMLRIFGVAFITLIFSISVFPVVHAETDQIEILIQNLNSEYRELRLCAVWTLGRVKDPRAVKALIDALQHKDTIVRVKAAEALGETRDPKAVEPLIAVLNDKEDTFREAAAKSLTKITGEDFGQDRDKWQKWWAQHKGSNGGSK
jgi:HEAT repeat protein